MTPHQLWDAALTLENDGEFYKAYVTQRPAEFSKDRRNLINTALGRLKIYSCDVKDREALRRYLDEAWNLPPARHATDSETNTGPVVEFWKEEVRYPPAKKPEPEPRNPTGLPAGAVWWRHTQWQWADPVRHGAFYTKEDIAKMVKMFYEGYAAPAIADELGRKHNSIAAKLATMKLLSFDSEMNLWHVGDNLPPMQQILSINHNTVPAEQIPTPLDQPQPTKETIMTTASIIEITTKTLINGIDIATMGDSAIYSTIANQEAEIKKLEAIENKPKRLVAEIEKRKAGIKALVDFLDSKEAK